MTLDTFLRLASGCCFASELTPPRNVSGKVLYTKFVISGSTEEYNGVSDDGLESWSTSYYDIKTIRIWYRSDTNEVLGTLSEFVA